MQKIQFYQNDYLDKMRTKTDSLADQTIRLLADDTSPKTKNLFQLIESLDKNVEINNLPEALQHYLEVSGEIPDWADFRMIRQAQSFFTQHASSLTMMLALMSLPYDYAAANGAQVLLLSERMQHDTRKRLLDTGLFVFNVASQNSFQKGGKAVISAQKVRLIHALVRFYILKSGQWNPEWGMPINQEDMAGTNLSMSLIPIRGMRKLGFNISKEQAEAYIHLWNVTSSIMGVEGTLLADQAKESYVLDKMISQRQFKPSHAGKTLTKSLLDFLSASMDPPINKLAPMYMRFLLGEQTADLLGIPRQELATPYLLNSLKYWNQFKNNVLTQKSSFWEAKTQLNLQRIK